MKKTKHLVALLMALFLVFSIVPAKDTLAAIKWGKVEVVKGMIGKFKVLKTTSIYSKSSKGTYKKIKSIKKGSEIKVYSYDSKKKYYKVSGGYIKKSSSVKYYSVPKSYKIPSEPHVSWGKIYLTKGVIGKVVVLKDTEKYITDSKGKKKTVKIKKGTELPVISYKNKIYYLKDKYKIKKSSKIKYLKPSKSTQSKLKKEIEKAEIEQEKKEEFYIISIS